MVRMATVGDIGSVAALAEQAAAAHTELDTAYVLRSNSDWAGYARERIISTASRVLVAEDQVGPTLVGFVDLRLVRPTAHVRGVLWRKIGKRRKSANDSDLIERVEAYGLIANLYVVPERRRGGIATALLVESLAWLGNTGVRDVEAAVLNVNVASVALFEKHGFAAS